jgi:hypothetical protein
MSPTPTLNIYLFEGPIYLTVMEYEGKCKSIDDDGIELEHFCSDDVEDVTDELIHEISEINQFESLVNVNLTVFVCLG